MTEIFSRNNNEWIITLNERYLIIRDFFKQEVFYHNFNDNADRNEWVSIESELGGRPYNKVANANKAIKTIIIALFSGKKFEEF